MRLRPLLLSSFILVSGLFVSCSEDTPEPEQGDILVINEGNFGQGNGSLSTYNREVDQMENDVFSEANDDRGLGASVQSVTVEDEVIFIICNTSDKIEIANATTLEAIQAPLEDEGLISPRYLTVSGNKAYVSVWGPFDANFSLTESKVAVININDYSIIKYIDVKAGPEDILTLGDQIFVANSFTNLLTVIDTNTDEVTEEITLDGSPQLLATYGEDLLVSVTGADSQFVLINPASNSIERTISVAGSNSNGKFVINQGMDIIYFLGAEPFPSTSTTVFEISIDEASSTYESIISGDNFYGLGLDPLSDDIFVGNSNSFQGEGTVLRYTNDGQLLNTYAVGVGPNGFVF